MIIVTGGAGFIGSNLIYRLNKINEKNIVICDILNSRFKKKYLKKARYKIIIPPSKLFAFLIKNKKKKLNIFFI